MLKFKSEYYLRINIRNRVKNANTCNHTLISWKMLIPFLFFLRNNSRAKISFCYCVSLSSFVWIYNHTVTIVTQTCWNWLIIIVFLDDNSLRFRILSQKISRPSPTFWLRSFLKNIKNFLRKEKIVNNRSIPSMHAIRKITTLSD